MSVKQPGDLPEGYSAVTLMTNRDQVAEDAHQCNFCTDFSYLSVIVCSNCNIHYCIWHNIHCGCNVPAVQLIYRFSSQEIRQYRAKINAAVERDQAQSQLALQGQ